MSRNLAIGLTIALMMVLMPVAAAHAACTLNGNKETNFAVGTQHHDRICTRGDKDYASGLGGKDTIRGGRGNDTMVGGGGRDHLLGLGGDDKIFAADGHGGDVIRGGKGRDACYGEKHDQYHSCAVKVTNNSPTYPLKMVLALQNAIARVEQSANKFACQENDKVCVIIKLPW